MKPLFLLMTVGLLLAADAPEDGEKEKPKGPGAVVAIDKKGQRELRERWTEAMRSLRIPGLAVVVVRGDEVILLETIGIRNLEKQPVTADTIFYIASCTKPYVATRLAQLADAEKLDLDAPVKQYLPRLRLKDPGLTEKLTVRDLLTHRQGLHSGPIVFLDAYSGEITEDRYYHFLGQVQPRGQCEYSNIHFTLAGRVLEKLEGKTWRDALRDQLFKPAGMTRTTGYASRMYGDRNCAVPLEPQGTGWVPTPVRKTDRTMHAAGGLGTTAADLGRWLRLNLNGGALDGQRVLSQKGLEQMHVLQVKAGQKTPIPEFRTDGFGLGWQVGSFKGQRVVSHGGGYAGAAALVSFMPEEKIGVAVLANTSGPAGPFTGVVATDVYRRLLKIDADDPLPALLANAKRYFERQAAAAPAPGPVGAKELSLAPAKYVGVYESEHWGTLRIEHKEGRLVAAIGDLPVELKSTGIDRLQVRAGPIPWSEARFEQEGEHVQGVLVELQGFGTLRFVRGRN